MNLKAKYAEGCLERGMFLRNEWKSTREACFVKSYFHREEDYIRLIFLSFTHSPQIRNQGSFLTDDMETRIVDDYYDYIEREKMSRESESEEKSPLQTTSNLTEIREQNRLKPTKTADLSTASTENPGSSDVMMSSVIDQPKTLARRAAEVFIDKFVRSIINNAKKKWIV